MKGSRRARATVHASVVACVLVLGLGGCDGARASKSAPVNPQPAETGTAQLLPKAPTAGDGKEQKAADLGSLGPRAVASATAAPPAVLGHGGGPGTVLQPVDIPAAPPAQKLDPNARYATTYRPGGAADRKSVV